MTILEHLDELRARLMVSIAALVVASCIAFWQVKAIVRFLVIPPVDTLVFFSPAEAFLAYCKVAVFAGLILSSPVIFYQFWCFVSTALSVNERRLVLACVPVSLALFLAGAIFAFSLVVPFALRFLINFAGPELVPLLSVSQYLSFVIMLTVIFGAVFELPVAIMLLAKLGIVTPAGLARNRKYAALIIFVAAAILTPTPDAFTQILLAAPLYALYEVSIILSRMVKRKGGES